jgi:hypothetical protein
MTVLLLKIYNNGIVHSICCSCNKVEISDLALVSSRVRQQDAAPLTSLLHGILDEGGAVLLDFGRKNSKTKILTRTFQCYIFNYFEHTNHLQ